MTNSISTADLISVEKDSVFHKHVRHVAWLHGEVIKLQHCAWRTGRKKSTNIAHTAYSYGALTEWM